MRRLSCADMAPGCEEVFTGSENEVISAFAEHSRLLHSDADHLIHDTRAALEHDDQA